MRPMTNDEFCTPKKTCKQNQTCGEAYYRYTHRGGTSLDSLPLGDNVPPPPRQPNGVPCEDRLSSGKDCGRSALAMATKSELNHRSHRHWYPWN